MNARILVVEDSSPLRKLMSATLRERGFKTYEAWSLQSARRLLPSVQPSVMLLDLVLEDEDGYELLHDAVSSGCPTIVVSSREKSTERVRCLMLGAADYLVKPVDFDELILRIQQADKLNTISQPVVKLIENEEYSIDLVNRRIKGKSASTEVLSSREFQLLLLFVEARGRTVSREEIASHVLGRPSLVAGRSVDVLVSKLRGKLETIGGGRLIETVRSVGYRILKPLAIQSEPALEKSWR